MGQNEILLFSHNDLYNNIITSILRNLWANSADDKLMTFFIIPQENKI